MNKFYQQAKFLLSCPSLKGCPRDQGYEVIFAGRSNAGKSSVINALTGQKKLAKVSHTPGKTQHLVFFQLDDDHRLVDLPGYGYAKVPGRVKKEWHINMREYFEKRQSLTGAVLLIDIRRGFTPFDQIMLNWCVTINLPTQILLTKADKLKRGAASSAEIKIMRVVAHHPRVGVQLFSSLKKQGLEELWHKLDTFFHHVD